MRVLICGGRDFTDFEEACNIVLDHLVTMSNNPPEKEDILFISGMARGADQIPFHLVDGEEDEWGGILEYPANWDKYGRRAGPIRNQQMLDEGKPDLVLAFPTPTSKGTWHMVKIAKEAGVPVYIYNTN